MVRKMFIVDDDADDRDEFRRAIESIDPEIRVTLATDGEDAFRRLAGIRPDVIFLDVVMPGMDGIECLTKLKSNRNTKHIPVIIYTASLNKPENELAIRLGAFQLLSKTRHFENLCSDIRRILTVLNRNN